MPRASKNNHSRTTTNPSTDRSEETKGLDIGNDVPCKTGSTSFEPSINWKFFQSLAMPGENVSYSLINGDGIFLENTQGCENVWGSTPNQLREKSVLDLIVEKKEFKNWLGTLCQEQEESTFRATLPRETKPAVELNIKSTPLFHAAHKSETRIVLKSLIHENYPSKQLFPFSSSLSSLHEKNGTFLSANLCWQDATGIDVNEIKEQSLQSLAIDLDKAKATRLLNKTKETQESQSAVLRIATKSNKVKSILATANLAPKGENIAIEAKNITIQSETIPTDLLKISIELIKESVVILSKAGKGFRISYVNKAFEELTQYKSATVIGGNTNFLNGPKTNAISSLSIEEALQKEVEHSVDLLLYKKDKTTFWSKSYLCPISDENGNTNHFITIFEDTTQAKEVAYELEKKNLELESALKDLQDTQKAIIQQENLRALGQMASGIAHDFNNLLAPILGFSELLLTIPAESRDESKLIAYLQKIQVAAQDGAAVVGRLREFYRSQSNKEEFDEIQPEDLISQVRELTRHRWKNQAEAKGVSIQLKTNCKSRYCIHGNESELRQVLTNLVINAVDAMDENGTITIDVSDKADRIQISVTDTGHGMSDDVKQKCLDPFYTTKGKLGTGLGLSIVLGVVQRHEGEFTVESEVGTGTSITMKLPAHAPTKSIQEEESQAETNNQSLRILLIDDEEILLEVISELLGSGGHVVDNFAEPKSALEQFKTRDYDLVITDRAMPGMSGDQLAAEMKKLKPETPIFMVTGFGGLIKESGEMPPNIDEVLGKPLPLDVLNLKLAELLNKKK